MNVHSLDPNIISFGAVSISWYWFFYLLSFALVLFFSYRSFNKEDLHLTGKNFLDLFLIGWVGLILGGRIGYVLIYNFDFYMNYPLEIIKLWNGGMSFHGALLLGGILTWIYAKYREVHYFEFSDIVVVYLPIALGLGRIGNYINGELWGRVSSVSWAMIFPRAGMQPRHPSQLYEAMTEGLLLFLILLFIKNVVLAKGDNAPLKIGSGILTVSFLVGYGFLRFVSEFFREPDAQMGFYLNYFSMGQILCAAMIFAGVALSLKLSLLKE